MDPTQRFQARAEAYARARPSYPEGTLDILRAHYGLSEKTRVADLGSGTGIFSRLLLQSGAREVFAVEPNDDMRKAAEEASSEDERFRSIAGRAEATTLADASIDLVTAAQAFHWFDLDRLIPELRRILVKEEGRAAFIWNDRDLDGTPFLRDYEAILVRHCPGYAELQGKSNTPEKFDRVFGRDGWTRRSVSNEQTHDRDGLTLRVMSSSYAPQSGAERDALVADLHRAFDHHAADGIVTIRYTTVVIGGAID